MKSCSPHWIASGIGFAALLGLQTGCIEIDAEVALERDGSVRTHVTALAPWYERPAAPAGGLWDVVTGLSDQGWTANAVADARGWQGFTATRRWTAKEVEHWLRADMDSPPRYRIVLQKAEDNTYMLRLAEPSDGAFRFEGESSVPPIRPDTTESFDASAFPADLAVLALRGVDVSLTLHLPGSVRDSSLERRGDDVVALRLDGNRLIRDYFAQTSSVPQDQRVDTLRSTAERQLVALTNAWVRFDWTAGSPAYAAALRTGGTARREQTPRPIIVTAPPIPREVASAEMGGVHLSSAQTRTTRSQREPELKTHTTWVLRFDRKDTLSKRLVTVHRSQATLLPVTTPSGHVSESPTLQCHVLNGWPYLSASCCFRNATPPPSVDELAGSVRLVFSDKPNASYTLTPTQEALYALQWTKQGQPRLDLIESTPGSIVIVAHRNTLSYVRESRAGGFNSKPEPWVQREDHINGTVRFERRPGHSGFPPLHLYKRLFLCDYNFSIKDARVP